MRSEPSLPRKFRLIVVVLLTSGLFSPGVGEAQVQQAPKLRLQIRQNGPIQLRRVAPAQAIVQVDVVEVDNGAEPVPREPLERDIGEGQQAANPLERLFRGIFQKPNQPIVPQNRPQNQAEAADPNAPEAPDQSIHDRDYVDRCAPHNAALEKMLDKAMRYVSNGNHKIAIELLQQILDQTGNDLVSVGPGKSELIRDVVNRVLFSLPAEAKELYQIQFAALAAQQWEEARDSGDPVVIADLATRYLMTPAGAQAADYLSSLHVERGEWASATIWFGRLREFYPNESRPPAWYLKAAVSFQRAGRPDEVNRILTEDLKGLESVRLAGESVSPAEFVSSISNRPADPLPVLSDWKMHGGNPRRSAVVAGEAPMLVPRWNLPPTHSRLIEAQIQELVDDLQNLGRAAIPISEPLVIGNRVIARTLQGVAVIDLLSGEQLWQTRQFHSPERILTGQQPNDNTYSEGVVVMGGVLIQEYQGTGPDQHPLSSLLFRDGIYGLLSSNGRHLYAIENHAWLSQWQPGTFYGNGAEENDRLRRSWNTNQLAAYDIATGHVVWEIGGEALNEPFDLPLAGTYFLGVPLVDGDRLYIVGEKENEVRLHCLDAVTGHPLWSQLIGYSLHALDRDFGRRWWTSQPAIADGVIVCPNTNGWLVAIDVTSHNVLWELRYKPAARRANNRLHRGDQQEGLVESRALNGEWRTSSPVIVDGKVYYAPMEHDVMHCVDLVSGKSLWSLARKNYLAMIGVYGQRILLLEENGIVAIGTDRELAWKANPETTLKNELGKVSGMPVVTNDEIFLPMDSGNLWRLSLKDGAVLGKQSVSSGHRPLGNLTFHNGRLVSVDPLGIRVFDLESTYRNQIATRRAANPDDSWCYLQEAQRKLQSDQYQDALELLRKVQPGELSSGEQDRLQASMYEALYTITSREPGQHDNLFADLQKYLSGDEQQLDVWKLRSERLVARGLFNDAFQAYLQIADTEDLERLMELGGQTHVRIRLKQWLGGQIAKLLQSVPGDVRTEIDAEIARRAEALNIAELSSSRTFLSLFDGHPAAVEVRWKLAEEFLRQNMFAEGEHHLLLLTAVDDRETAARSWLKLIDLYRNRNRETALWDAVQNARNAVGEISLDGRTVASILDEQQQAWDLHERPKLKLAQWGDFDLEVESGAMSYQIMQQYQAKMHTRLQPAVSDFRIDYNRNSQRLRITNRNDDKMLWSVPLRSGAYNYNREAGQIRSLGHLLLVQQSNGISMLSPDEKRVIWTRSLENSNYSRNYYRSYSNNSSLPSMVLNGQVVTAFGLMKEEREDNAACLSGKFLCVQGQRDLQVYETISGTLLWTIEKLPNNVIAFAGEDHLYVLSTHANSEDSYRIRFRDAEVTPLGESAGLLRTALLLDGDDVVVVQQTTKRILLSTKSVYTLRRVNLLTGEEVWSFDLSDNPLLQKTENSFYALDRTTGKLSRIDFATGRAIDVAQLDSFRNERSSQHYLLETTDRIYIVQNNSKSSRPNVYRNYHLDGVFVHGTVHAIDRSTGNVIWSKPVESQFLLTELLEDSPVLLFAARSQFQKGNIWRNEQHTLILDSRDGRELYKKTGAFSNDVQALHINHETRNILLVSYNQKLSFRAVDRKPAEETKSGEQQPNSGTSESGPDAPATKPASPE